MANTTLGGLTLHNGSTAVIVENTCRKESTLTIVGLYTNDSDLTDVFDFGGTVKIITLTGSFKGENVAQMKSFIDSAESLIQGAQDISHGYPLTFVDDIRGTIKVKCLDFDSTVIEGESARCTWAFKLVQSSTNG